MRYFANPIPLVRMWRYWKQNGSKALLKRCLNELKSRLPYERPIRAKAPVLVSKPHPQRTPQPLNPQDLYICLDEPGENISEITRTLHISGWVCAVTEIEAIDLYLDGVFLQELHPGLARPDVAVTLPQIPSAAQSGFAKTIQLDNDVQLGEHTLLLAFHDKVGSCAILQRQILLIENDILYHQYYLATLPSKRTVRQLKAKLYKDQAKAPFFEWWIIADSLEGLSRTLTSISTQSYANWHCYLVAPKEQWHNIMMIVKAISGAPTLERFSCKLSVSVSTKPQVENAYVGFFKAGETLAPHALLRWATELVISQPGLSYTDHDQIKSKDLHCGGHFKPDWSPDYALSRNYIGGIYVVRQDATLIDTIMSLVSSENPDIWRYELWLRLTELSPTVHHLPQVLWSSPFQETADISTLEGELNIVMATLRRRGQDAVVEPVNDGSIRHIQWLIPEPSPLVSIIIPTTGRLDLVKTCIESIRNHTKYPAYELIFLDNGHGKYPDGIQYLHEQKVRVIEHHEDFNWARLNNIGAAAASGDMLLFMNDDIEVTESNWLDELVSQVARPEIGVVGALLLYPNGCIQHAGIFLVDHGGGARHYLQFLDPTKEIYQHLHQTVREVSANTGACFIVRRNVFDEVNGFDENFAIVGNDVDMCLRIAAAGYRNLWTPFAQLIHHESLSRKHIPINTDERKIWQRWQTDLISGDPFYNPNLTKVKSDCSLKHFPEGQSPAQETLSIEELGVNLIGYIRAEMGVGEATRGVASALHAAHIPFGIINYERHNPSRMGDNSWTKYCVDQPEQLINILHVNADLTDDAVAHLPDDYFVDRYTIGYWAWELPEFPDDWLHAFTHVNEVWVPSFFVQEAVSRKSPVPVIRMPHAVQKSPIDYLQRNFFELPDTPFLFLMMYDTHSSQARKNPQGAIRAFCEAFSPARLDVGLVVKVNNANETELNELYEVVKDYKSIHILDTVLSRHEVDSLIHCCDCFVSLHRSEGFGLAIAEAMALGRPVIATGWSGNMDFMGRHNAACVNYQLQEIGQDYGPYKADQIWAEPDITDAARWMYYFAEKPDDARKLGQQAKIDIETQLSPAKIGHLIYQRLTYIHY